MTDEDRKIVMENANNMTGGRSVRNMLRGGRSAAMLPQSKRRSSTAGVQKHQANDFNNQVKAAGIRGIEYCIKTGDMMFSTQRAKQKELKRRRIFAKDSIFSPQND